MPANLTPQYMAAEQRFKQASTHEEKIACLEEMLRVIPKHKGTDKLQADLKRRLSKLRQEAQKAAATHRGFSLSAQRGQIGAARSPHQSHPRSGRLSLHDTPSHAGHDAFRECANSTRRYAAHLP